MKKILSLLLACTLAMSVLAGCGSSGSGTAANAITAKDGLAEGKLGDTFATKWFNWTATGAELADSYGTLKAGDGCTYLIVHATVENTFGEEVPMYANDFQLIWGDGDDDNARPLNGLLDLNTQKEMFPTEYALAKGETRTGDSVFKVPAGITSFGYAFCEYLEDGSEGDVFVVYFDVNGTDQAA